jgi:hypothetical protein
MDSQSVKTTEAGSPSGFDAAKKVKGRKRNALVDIDGRALVLQVGSAAIQDREGGVPPLMKSRNRFPFIERPFSHSAYLGERFFVWISRNRRLSKDIEATLASTCTFLYATSVMLLTRRLGRSQ